MSRQLFVQKLAPDSTECYVSIIVYLIREGYSINILSPPYYVTTVITDNMGWQSGDDMAPHWHISLQFWYDETTSPVFNCMHIKIQE